MKNAIYKENKDVLSEEGQCRSKAVGEGYAETQESET
jgi:hypothetical protein